MANEITMVAGLSAAKGDKVMAPGTVTRQQDMNGNDLALLTATATTTAAAVPVGLVDTAKLYSLYVHNIDPTNFIELSNATAADFNAGRIAKLLPNMMTLIPREGAVYIRADTASCEYNIRAVENAA